MVPRQALTLIILFSEILIYISSLHNFLKESMESSRVFYLSNWKIQKIINYSTDVCPFFLIFERQIGVPPKFRNFGSYKKGTYYFICSFICGKIMRPFLVSFVSIPFLQFFIYLFYLSLFHVLIFPILILSIFIFFYFYAFYLFVYLISVFFFKKTIN